MHKPWNEGRKPRHTLSRTIKRISTLDTLATNEARLGYRDVLKNDNVPEFATCRASNFDPNQHKPLKARLLPTCILFDTTESDPEQLTPTARINDLEHA